MILKISLRAKAGVPKSKNACETKTSPTFPVFFPQNTLMLTDSAANSVICLLLLDFVCFAVNSSL